MQSLDRKEENVLGNSISGKSPGQTRKMNTDSNIGKVGEYTFMLEETPRLTVDY